MAPWLVYLTPAQVVCVQALARDIMCCVPRKDNKIFAHCLSPPRCINGYQGI